MEELNNKKAENNTYGIGDTGGKKFCIECKHFKTFSISPFPDQCGEPENVQIVDGPIKQETRYFRTPAFINYNNKCNKFEAKDKPIGLIQTIKALWNNYGK